MNSSGTFYYTYAVYMLHEVVYLILEWTLWSIYIWTNKCNPVQTEQFYEISNYGIYINRPLIFFIEGAIF